MDQLAEGRIARQQPGRLPILLTGVLFAQGRRTVSTSLRAAGVSPDYEDYYYFLASVGGNAKLVSWRLLALVLRIVPLPERELAAIDYKWLDEELDKQPATIETSTFNGRKLITASTEDVRTFVVKNK